MHVLFARKLSKVSAADHEHSLTSELERNEKENCLSVKKNCHMFSKLFKHALKILLRTSLKVVISL